MADNLYESITVEAPNGASYRIPRIALDDWNSWLEIAGDRWVPPNYAKVDEDDRTA